MINERCGSVLELTRIFHFERSFNIVEANYVPFCKPNIIYLSKTILKDISHQTSNAACSSLYLSLSSRLV
jgi:hypothetical protein